MDKVMPLLLAEVQPVKKGRRTAYLIAVHQKRDALRVYAVVASSSKAALAQLEGLTIDRMEVEVVGALSRNLTRSLGLKPGEMRLV